MKKLQRVSPRSLASKFTTKVVGVTYVREYPSNLLAMKDRVDSNYLFSDNGSDDLEMIPVLLVRNPNNEFDSNAIEVHVSEGSLRGPGNMIGHVPASIASLLAPKIDAGEEWTASIVNIGIDPNHPMNPGASIRISKVN